MKVKITETLERIVEAESMEAAEMMYRNSEIILDAEDYVGVEFAEHKEEIC